MNPYSHFKKRYYPSLLEGQSLILKELEEKFFPVLQETNPPYFPTLARMPTGTGKSGVIAVATYFGNPNGSTLVLTPWKNLCDQLKTDLEGEFWDHLKLSAADRKKFLIPTERMFPSKLTKLLRRTKGKRIVLIGTLNGLQRLERYHQATYKILSQRISLVIVDEGHYEPAVLWGRAVRDLARPTLIVTATPYRNDLKLFRVRGDRVLHYEHWRALNEPRFPLRRVEPVPLKATSKEFESLVKEFVKKWKSNWRKQLPDLYPRAIICCESKNRVKQALEIISAAKLTARAFHERVEPEDFNHLPEVGKFFQREVPRAKESKEQIWIHQNKLTEGVDDPRFAVVLLTYVMSNDRKLIQQVGRILRHSSGVDDDTAIQTALRPSLCGLQVSGDMEQLPGV
jgi:hypothetical protein